MNESINDKFVKLKINLADAERFIKSKELYPQDLASAIETILGNCFNTCNSIISLTKNTINDYQDKERENENKKAE